MLGYFQEVYQTNESISGYAARILMFKGDDQTFPVSEAVFREPSDPKYEHPKFEELLFSFEPDENGVIGSLSEFESPDVISYGCNDKICGTLQAYEDRIAFVGFGRMLREGRISYWGSYHKGEAAEIDDATVLRLSPDAAWYSFDWTAELKRTRRIDKAEADRQLADNVRWFRLERVSCEPGTYDCVTLYPNVDRPGGPGGNLAEAFKHH